MGFWTIGPVAGSLITSIVALHTLNHFGSTHWKSQFVIAGCSALVVFLISLFALKDLSPQIRDQLMVSARDQALVEARARGLTDRQLLEAAERPWRQILQWDLVVASVAIALFLLLYYAAASLFTIYYPVIFKNPNGTNFTRHAGQRTQHVVLGGRHRRPDRRGSAVRRAEGPQAVHARRAACWPSSC